MIIREIENKNEWEDFLQLVPEKTFLQSWNWGEFQKALGKKIWRLGIYKNNQLKGVGLVFKSPIIQLRKYQRNFLFCPHGPLILEKNPSFVKDALESLSKRNEEARCRISLCTSFRYNLFFSEN